ncbi:MAG: hypothetical protein ACLRQN_06745 [Bacteroides faecis]
MSWGLLATASILIIGPVVLGNTISGSVRTDQNASCVLTSACRATKSINNIL